MIEHVAFLVANTPLHRDGPEHLVDGGSEGLAAVQDDQNTLLDVKAPLDEVGEQMHGDSLVLGGAIPQPERDLDALGAHAQSDDAAAALQLDPVEHQRRQAHIRERTGHQRRQVLAGPGDELAADRRLRRGALRGGHGRADGLTGPGETSGGNTREHLLQNKPTQRVTVSEIRIRRERHLVLPAGGAGPWMLHRDTPAAERDLPVFVAVTNSGSFSDGRVLGADDLVELGLHHLAQHAQPDAHAERQQPLLCGAHELSERFLHTRRQTLRAAVLLLHYGLHGGSLRLMDLFALATVPTGPDKAKGTATYKLLRATGQPRRPSWPDEHRVAHAHGADDHRHGTTHPRDRSARGPCPRCHLEESCPASLSVQAAPCPGRSARSGHAGSVSRW